MDVFNFGLQIASLRMVGLLFIAAVWFYGGCRLEAQLTSGSIEPVPSVSAHALRSQKKGFVEKVRIRVPKAITAFGELVEINPALPVVWPGLAEVVSTATASPNYKELYRRKLDYLKRGGVLDDHNFLDCATALQLTHKASGRRMLLVQADMDTVTDGSDPVRAGSLADYDIARGSDWFLPQTAYGWVDPESPRNPFLDYYPASIARLDHYRELFLEEAEVDKGRIWRVLIASVDSQKLRMKTAGLEASTVRGLKNTRYLIGVEDPFVVLPSFWFSGKGSWTPRIGDYAAVIYGDKVYPAILGEAGPTFKIGEASLRIAKAIDPEASGTRRAVSSLGVTYVIFPRTASHRQAPDHAMWRDRVAELMEEVGVSTSALHQWD